jgi:transcriptional regulator with XRE-family HTH domain
MHTPAELLDAIRERHNLPSDYAVAKTMGVPRQLVSRWRQGHGGMSDDHAARVAELLGLDPGHVLARLYAERATSDHARSLWLDLARRLGPVAAGLAALFLLPPYLGTDGATLGGLLASLGGCFEYGLLFVMSSLAGAIAAAVALIRTGEARTLHPAGGRASLTA